MRLLLERFSWRGQAELWWSARANALGRERERGGEELKFLEGAEMISWDFFRIESIHSMQSTLYSLSFARQPYDNGPFAVFFLGGVC
jgi:hypothetical protein